MNAAQLVSSSYLKGAGKLPTFASGSVKWQKILAIANDKIDIWQNETDANWNSLYEPSYLLSAVTATNTYSLDDEIRTLSDNFGDTVDIKTLSGNTVSFGTVAANKLKLYKTGNYCAQVGRNLIFNRTFTATSPEFGGSIVVPVYLFATHLVRDTDIVPVDDPQWLVIMTAAEYDRNDLLKQNQYPGLVSEANALMEGMKAVNDSQVEEVTKVAVAHGMNW